jgi:hypothetical protein
MVKKGILMACALILTLSISCKNASEEKKAQEANKQEKVKAESGKMGSKRVKSKDVYHGEFIFTDTAAVLKGDSFIYGVKLDSLSRDLGEKIQPMMENQYQMVPVVVKGDLKKNQNEGWDEILTIKKVLAVEKPKDDESIKITSKKDKNQ